ncbi:hypothetical protein CCR75_009051 [Bremia lactucae]|uniref:Uncharacterized protein n=1 Tax=Bremia lactucae TaxID=4779 RepID=A0A976IJP8_BRELC|nr:hypothetical protein CCR75_009051 [Bremia lactucae]
MEYRVRKRDIHGADRLPRSLEEALPDAVVRRFLLRAGFCSSSDRAVTKVRRHVSDFFRRIVSCMVVMMQHDGRRSFRLIDVKRACEHFGIRMYGYDDMCLLAAGRLCGPEAFHVTELVECNSLFGRPNGMSNEPDTEPGAFYKRTDFVANYMSWKRELGETDDQVSESSDWAFSDSDTESQGDQDVDMDTSQPWQPDEDKFVASLQDAQELVDERLLHPAEDEEAEGETGQGYFSDFDSSNEPSYVTTQKVFDADEDAQWKKVGNLHTLQNDEDCYPAKLQGFGGSLNVYVIPRQEFSRIFGALLHLTLNIGELQITSVALSALHNATEQCLHRSLTEGSLHYQLTAILENQNYTDKTNWLESELQMHRDKVNQLCKTIAANKEAFKAKELALQRQIEQLRNQLLGQHKENSESPKLKKKSPSKRKAISKVNCTMDKGLPKTSISSASVVGALHLRSQNQLESKKAKFSLV